MRQQNPNRKILREKRSRFWSSFYAAIIYALFYIPVLVMIQFSFNDAKRNYSWEGFMGSSFPFATTISGKRWSTRSSLPLSPR